MTAVAASVVLIASLIMVSSGASADLCETSVCLSGTCRKGNSTDDPAGGRERVTDLASPDLSHRSPAAHQQLPFVEASP
jgi:hypothetical protein